MTKSSKAICETILEFNKQGIKPFGPEIYKKLKMNMLTFYNNRNYLEENGIIVPHERESVVEYSLNKAKYKAELKKEELSVDKLAKKAGVSRMTIYNRLKRSK